MTELPPTLSPISQERDCQAEDPGNCRFHRTGIYANKPSETPINPGAPRIKANGEHGIQTHTSSQQAEVVHMRDAEQISKFCKSHSGNEWTGYKNADGSVTFAKKGSAEEKKILEARKQTQNATTQQSASAEIKASENIIHAKTVEDIGNFCKSHSGNEWTGYRQSTGEIIFAKKGSEEEKKYWKQSKKCWRGGIK